MVQILGEAPEPLLPPPAGLYAEPGLAKNSHREQVPHPFPVPLDVTWQPRNRYQGREPIHCSHHHCCRAEFQPMWSPAGVEQEWLWSLAPHPWVSWRQQRHGSDSGSTGQGRSRGERMCCWAQWGREGSGRLLPDWGTCKKIPAVALYCTLSAPVGRERRLVVGGCSNPCSAGCCSYTPTLKNPGLTHRYHFFFMDFMCWKRTLAALVFPYSPDLQDFWFLETWSQIIKHCSAFLIYLPFLFAFVGFMNRSLGSSWWAVQFF